MISHDEKPEQFKHKRLTEKAAQDRIEFNDYDPNECSCHLSAPCGWCLHPGNPANQNEDETCWEIPTHQALSIQLDLTAPEGERIVIYADTIRYRKPYHPNPEKQGEEIAETHAEEYAFHNLEVAMAFVNQIWKEKEA